jgi:poly-beta-1,6-N-acetyl-D-glucosamine N-deacetylase
MKKQLALLAYIMVIFTFIYAMFSESYQTNNRIYYKDRVAVLTYNHIAPEESAYTISPLMFRKHLQALKDNHYNVFSVEKFIDFLQGKKNIPPNAVVITFDDGYESFYKYRYPEMKKQNITATNFIVVSSINSPFHKPGILNWNQIMEMKKDGFSFYSHTYNSHSFVID